MGDSDDEIRLPDDTLAILSEFLQQKAKQEAQNDNFEENWQLSQFWYNEATKKALASASKRIIEQYFDPTATIGLLSCPSLYTSVKEIHPEVKIFEFDERFASFGVDFVPYDYTKANEEGYLDEFRARFDLLIIDPPFLSEECIEKVSKIVQKIARPNAKIILCSGRIVKTFAERYLTLTECNFRPEHERNLGNEFTSYANFDLDDIIKAFI